jgi:signal transduction histidine kinase
MPWVGWRRLTTRVDATLALLLVVGAIWQTLDRGGSEAPLRAALAAATVGGLVWRRSRPVLSALWVAAGLIVESVVTESTDEYAVLIGVVIASFSVAAHARVRDAIAGLVGLAVGIAMTIALDPSDDLANVAPTLVLFTALPAAGGFLFGRRGRDLAESQLRAESLEQELKDATAAERTRIAREMHDVVSHAITVVAVQAEAGRSLAMTDPTRARRSFEAIGEASRDALAELHSLLALMPEQGSGESETVRGLDTVPALIESARAAGLDVTLTESGPIAELPPEHDHCAFRAVQEGITNALRHSQRPDLAVRIQRHSTGLRVEVHSTGRKHLSTYGGMGRGLVGLRERAQALGGQFTSGPTENGFYISLSLPGTQP